MKEKEEVKKQRKEPYHFSPAQMQLIEEYMDCSMTKLKTLCRTIWLKDTLDQKYYDDLYDDAMTVLMETVESYNPEHEKKASFNTFLMGNIKRSYLEWRRDNFERGIRCNLLIKNGVIVKDEEDKPIVVQNISLDTPIQNDEQNGKTRNVEELVASRFNLEELICEKEKTEDEKWHPKVRIFLHRLSPLQQKIALLIANRYNKDEICEVLHISEKTYEHSFKMICSEKNKQLIRNL